jgi:hypothetical protein
MRHSSLFVLAAAAASVALISSCATGPVHKDNPADEFSFALIADMPYAADQGTEFARLTDVINGDRKLSWVIHLGDFKGGSAPCTDSVFVHRLDLFQRFERPFIFIPGDNDWADCHRTGSDLLERQAKMRSVFFSEPGRTLGQRPMRVETQATNLMFAGYPEHVRWKKNGVVFAALHIVGSLNSGSVFEGRLQAHDDEVEQRTNAAIAWMQQSFEAAVAEKSAGLFLMIHGNPRFEAIPADTLSQQAYGGFVRALEREVIRFNKPVILAHGDSHYFRIDKPLRNSVTGRRLMRFTRVEPFGVPDMHWVRVVVDPEDDQVFTILPEIVPENLDIP